MKGLSDSEACILADIAPSTLYDYQKNNPEFSERKQALKQNVNLKAKMAIVRAIDDGCVATSKWWLERRCREEFSLRAELAGDKAPIEPPEITVKFVEAPASKESIKEVLAILEDAKGF